VIKCDILVVMRECNVCMNMNMNESGEEAKRGERGVANLREKKD